MLLKFICGADVTPCDHGLTVVCLSCAFLNDRIDFERTGDNFPLRCTFCHLDVSRKVQWSVYVFSNHSFCFKISFIIENSGPCMGTISGLISL